MLNTVVIVLCAIALMYEGAYLFVSIAGLFTALGTLKKVGALTRLLEAMSDPESPTQMKQLADVKARQLGAQRHALLVYCAQTFLTLCVLFSLGYLYSIIL